MRPRDAALAGGVAPGASSSPFRADFPVFARRVNGVPLVYLDSAATTQKPHAVIEAVRTFYASRCANVHRGLHTLSSEATRDFEEVREKLSRFIGAESSREIVFTSGATAAINLVAHAFGQSALGPGDEVLLTQMEHHSNIVPWQLACERTGARLRVVTIDDAGELRLDEYRELLGPRTRIVAVTHTSNSLGTRNPIPTITREARARGIPVLVDAAQAMAHERIDVEALGCDFLAFSGHKMLGPTGVGVLWGRYGLLEGLPPFLGGGEMIEAVRFEGTTYKKPPQRFEAGTPDIAGVIGLGAAVDYLTQAGLDRIASHEADLLAYADARLAEVPGLQRIGAARRRAGILSFNLRGIHSHDVAQWLDGEGVAVRAGHHCAQPVMERFGVSSTVRASLSCYNTREDIDVLVRGLLKTIEVMGR